MAKNKDLEFVEKLRVDGRKRFRLSGHDPASKCGFPGKEWAGEALAREHERLEELQNKLYAQGKHALLVVLQAMDTGGKDGTIRRCMGPLNPQGVRVTSFKKPTAEELAHDYLWRIHRAVPPRGMIGIFNRSHYEDVLIARVHGLAPRPEIERRYDQINAFEKHLAANGVSIVKIFLHISKDEQKERLQERLDFPEKHWKFNRADLDERELWDEYMKAYEIALRRCAAPHAPWHVIPANRKWARNLAVTRILRMTLEKMRLRYPPGEEGLDQFVIGD